jgi:energy-coupling factor transporter transmembrane protein EcfT
MDEQGSRTMFVGLIIAFALYGLSFVVTAVYGRYVWASWVSIGLILVSVLFLGVWFLSVRGGFRIGKQKSRAARRAAMHAKEEREKRMRLNR